MTIEFTDVLEQRATKSGLAVAPHGGDMSGLLKQMRADSPPQFAIITRSLGSYVLFDALAHSTEVALAQVRTKARIETSDLPQVAPASILCFAKQVHMMANQLPLLRLSEIVVDGPSAAPPEVQAFSNCSQLRKEVAETDEAVQVVAYHEPNDLLTFYIDDPEVTGFTFTNVIASFAKIWVPFVVANPTQAHTGQAGKDSIMDILASGYAAGRSDSPDD